MPLKRGATTKDGKKLGYYQGKSKKHTYEPGNDWARRLAKTKALKDTAK